jgi:hypothetical protein
MFLPVLLMRDYGPWAWVAFAIPNVIGAAAMGWMIRSKEHSAQMIAAHGRACAAFSIVTLAFHILFAFLIASLASALVMGIVTVVFLVVFTAGEFRRKADLWTAGLVWVTSLLMLCGVYLASNDPVNPMPLGVADGRLMYLVPVVIFGFLLCPYLDLTFHRARQAVETPAAARVAFGVGFGLVFLLMIVGTFVYAQPLATAFTYGLPRSYLGMTLAGALALHMGIQAGFTVSVHIRALRGAMNWAVLPILVVVAIGATTYPLFDGVQMNWFEGAYRLFMGFYGLVFPAYVWICMIPTWRRPAAPSRRAWVVCGIAIVVAAPMFWMGFVQGQTAWLLPGIAVVLLARLLVPGTKTEAPPSPIHHRTER